MSAQVQGTLVEAMSHSKAPSWHFSEFCSGGIQNKL